MSRYSRAFERIWADIQATDAAMQERATRAGLDPDGPIILVIDEAPQVVEWQRHMWPNLTYRCRASSAKSRLSPVAVAALMQRPMLTTAPVNPALLPVVVRDE